MTKHERARDSKAVPFKKCQPCGFEWDSRDDFLGDPNMELIGYQANFDELETGLFLLNHSCHATLAIQASEFRDLYDGPVFAARATGSDECPGYCLRKNELRPCPTECECAYVREIIQVIKGWTKG